MPKEIWINLPVKNVAKSIAFFTTIGFKFNTQHTTEHSACMLVGEKNTVVMLFEERVFQGFSQNPLADTTTGTEILLSFDAASREEVDAVAVKAVAAGGNLFAKPAEFQGFMYGCAFADLDGHRWNALFMNQ